MRKHVPHFVFAACLGIIGTVLFWVAFGSAPWSSYSATLRIFFKIIVNLNVIPIHLGAIFPTFGGCEILVFVQWFLVGLGLSYFSRRLRRRNDSP